MAPRVVPARAGTLITSGTPELATLRATAFGVARATLAVTAPGTTAAATTATGLPISVSTLTPRSPALAVSRDRTAITETATPVIPTVARQSCVEAGPAAATIAGTAEPVVVRPVPVGPSAPLPGGRGL
jgi:hypothetical protein